MPMNRYIPVLLAAVLFAACSTTKRLAEGEQLYTGVKKMNIEPPAGMKLPAAVESEIRSSLSVKPNNPLYSPYVRTPFPIGLWVYNNFYRGDSVRQSWLYRKLAKTPVLVSDVKPDLRMRMVGDIMDNHGYFGSGMEYEIVQKKNPRKVRISYDIKAAPPWYYNSIEYPPANTQIGTIIGELKGDSRLRVGARYDTDSLSDERIRISNILRDRSFYYFRPNYLEYLADTTVQRYKVDLRMVMAQGIPPDALRPYMTGNVTINLLDTEGGKPDSTYVDNIKVRYFGKLRLRPAVIRRITAISPGAPATVSSTNKTLSNYTKLGVFRYVDLEVTPLDSIRGGDSLDMTLSASFDLPLQAQLEVDFSTKSNSFIGPALTLGIRHGNFLRGGEALSVKLNGNYEWQTGNTGTGAFSSAINSYQFGVNTSLALPYMVAPRFVPRSSRYSAHTTFALGGNIMKRPNFFTMLSANTYVSYDFQSDAYASHNITLLKFTYNDLLRTTAAFDSTMLANPALAQSFIRQLIPSASYTITYDRSYGSRNQDRLIWQASATTAGNILAGIYAMAGKKGTKYIFGIPFSQFVKGTFEIKYYKRVMGKNTLALRFMAGAGYAYGNSDVLPYSEQFYVGGANSIRAFTIRSLGPGGYSSDEWDMYGYFDRTGDFKAEATAELRFPIIAKLGGAVFLDAGNIWLLENDPTRPGGTIGSGNILEQIALGTGAGLRYDLSFLVIRADLGIGIHLPYRTERAGYYNIPSFREGLGFHLAIGYPF